MSADKPPSDLLDFLIGVVCTVGIIIAFGCMVHLAVSAT